MGKLLAASVLLVLTIPAGAQLKVSDISVFQLPEMNQQQMRATLPIVGLFQAKKYGEAEQKLRNLIEKFPQWPIHHYNLGAALARQGKKEEALDSLERAITLGFSSRSILARDEDYAVFHKEPRFIELVSRTGTALAGKPNLFRRRTAPAPIIEGVARVEPENTQWVAHANALVSKFDLKNLNVPERVKGGDERVAQFLNRWYERGESAGNVGDFYDNRDRGHSGLVDGVFPQVTAVEYGEAAKSAGMNYGVSAPLYFNAITVGNSSTAINHAQFGRSQPRLIMTRPGLLRIASQQYANDHLYIYPEHRDHDPEKGDLFPANTPYMLVSQGSSRSDKPFIEAAFSVLAAFTPETKEFLREKRLVMPTVQKIIRSGMGQVATRDHYMSALAHPSVFEGKDINLEKMVTLAHGLKKEDVPPRIFLTVKKESKPSLGVGLFWPPHTWRNAV